MASSKERGYTKGGLQKGKKRMCCNLAHAMTTREHSQKEKVGIRQKGEGVSGQVRSGHQKTRMNDSSRGGTDPLRMHEEVFCGAQTQGRKGEGQGISTIGKGLSLVLSRGDWGKRDYVQKNR